MDSIVDLETSDQNQYLGGGGNTQFDAEAVNRCFLTRRDEGRYRVVTD
ncbi:MAG: hypothetical protein KDC53_06360 [Saprospiraceae bacterium]|nr:hypothetical protein [Saprospiraceae bacterium]